MATATAETTRLRVNGVEREIAADPATPLLSILRGTLGLAAAPGLSLFAEGEGSAIHAESSLIVLSDCTFNRNEKPETVADAGSVIVED